MNMMLLLPSPDLHQYISLKILSVSLEDYSKFLRSHFLFKLSATNCSAIYEWAYVNKVSFFLKCLFIEAAIFVLVQYNMTMLHNCHELIEICRCLFECNYQGHMQQAIVSKKKKCIWWHHNTSSAPYLLVCGIMTQVQKRWAFVLWCHIFSH